jgi:hypothetical protein
MPSGFAKNRGLAGIGIPKRYETGLQVPNLKPAALPGILA